MYNYYAKSRQRVSYSFIASIILHIIAVLVVVIKVRLSIPAQMEPTTLIDNSITVELYNPPAPRFSQAVFRMRQAKQASVSVPMRRSNTRKSIQRNRSESRIEKPIHEEEVPIDVEVKITSNSEPFFLDKVHNSPAPLNSEPREANLESSAKDPSTTEEGELEGSAEQRSGSGSLSEFDIDNQIGSAMNSIAGQAVAEDTTGMVDVVFLLDISGSMEGNIHAVGNHLSDMADMFVKKGLDFTLGVVKFRYVKFLLFPQTKDISKYQRLLKNVQCGGDERAYDAIVKTLDMVQFRPGAQRRFIMVTDEKMKGSYSTIEVIKRCQEAQVKLDVIGTDDVMDKHLARQTGGVWYAVPGD
ncbi:VWA domain-containing protein [Candidatus Poribacteria bacterium]|nr:VWA domain-containing protein [Candidatus Poribacteria bacterium]